MERGERLRRLLRTDGLDHLLCGNLYFYIHHSKRIPRYGGIKTIKNLCRKFRLLTEIFYRFILDLRYDKDIINCFDCCFKVAVFNANDDVELAGTLIMS